MIDTNNVDENGNVTSTPIQLFTIREDIEKPFEMGGSKANLAPNTTHGLDEILKFRASKYALGEEITNDEYDEPGYYLVRTITGDTEYRSRANNIFSSGSSVRPFFFNQENNHHIVSNKTFYRLENKSSTKFLYMYDDFVYIIYDKVSKRVYDKTVGVFEIRDTYDNSKDIEIQNIKDLSQLSQHFGIFFHFIKKTRMEDVASLPGSGKSSEDISAEDYRNMVEFYDYAFLEVDSSSGEHFMHLKGKTDVWHYNGLIDEDYCKEYEVMNTDTSYIDPYYDISGCIQEELGFQKWSKAVFPRKMTFKRSHYDSYNKTYNPVSENFKEYLVRYDGVTTASILQPASDSTSQYADHRGILGDTKGMYLTPHGTRRYGYGQLRYSASSYKKFIGFDQSMIVKLSLKLSGDIISISRFSDNLTYANFGDKITFYILNTKTGDDLGSYDVTGTLSERIDATSKPLEGLKVRQLTRAIYEVTFEVPKVEDFTKKVDSEIVCSLSISDTLTPEIYFHEALDSNTEVSSKALSNNNTTATIVFNSENRVINTEVVKHLNSSLGTISHSGTTETFTLLGSVTNNVLIPSALATEYTYSIDRMNTLANFTVNGEVRSNSKIESIQYRLVGEHAFIDVTDKKFTLQEASTIEVLFTFTNEYICIDEEATSCGFMSLGDPGFNFDGRNKVCQKAVFTLPAYNTSINVFIKLRRFKISVWNTSANETFAKHGEVFMVSSKHDPALPSKKTTGDTGDTGASPVYQVEDVLNVRASSDQYEYFPGEKIKILYDLAANLRLFTSSCVYIKNADKTYSINDGEVAYIDKNKIQTDNSVVNGRNVFSPDSKDARFFVDETLSALFTMYSSDMEIYLYPTYIAGIDAITINENEIQTFKPIIKDYNFRILQIGCRTGNGGNGGVGGASLGGAAEREANYNGLEYFPFRKAANEAVAAWPEQLHDFTSDQRCSSFAKEFAGYASLAWSETQMYAEIAVNTSGNPGGNGGNGYIGGNGGRASDPTGFHIIFLTISETRPTWFTDIGKIPLGIGAQVQNIFAGWPDFTSMQLVGGCGSCGGHGGVGFIQSGKPGAGTASSHQWYSNGRDGFTPLSALDIVKDRKKMENANYLYAFKSVVIDNNQKMVDKTVDKFAEILIKDMTSYIGAIYEYTVNFGEASATLAVGTSGSDGVDGSNGDFRRPGCDGAGGGGGGPTAVVFSKEVEINDSKYNSVVCMGGVPGGCLTTSFGGAGGTNEEQFSSNCTVINNAILNRYGTPERKIQSYLDELVKWMTAIKDGTGVMYIEGENYPSQKAAAADWLTRYNNTEDKNNLIFGAAAYISLVMNVHHGGHQAATRRTRYDRYLNRYFSFGKYLDATAITDANIIKSYSSGAYNEDLSFGFYLPGYAFDNVTSTLEYQGTAVTATKSFDNFNFGFGYAFDKKPFLGMLNPKTATGGRPGSLPMNFSTVGNKCLLIRQSSLGKKIPKGEELVGGKRLGSVGLIVMTPVGFKAKSLNMNDAGTVSQDSSSHLSKAFEVLSKPDITTYFGTPGAIDEDAVEVKSSSVNAEVVSSSAIKDVWEAGYLEQLQGQPAYDAGYGTGPTGNNKSFERTVKSKGYDYYVKTLYTQGQYNKSGSPDLNKVKEWLNEAGVIEGYTQKAVTINHLVESQTGELQITVGIGPKDSLSYFKGSVGYTDLCYAVCEYEYLPNAVNRKPFEYSSSWKYTRKFNSRDYTVENDVQGKPMSIKLSGPYKDKACTTKYSDDTEIGEIDFYFLTSTPPRKSQGDELKVGNIVCAVGDIVMYTRT